MPIKKTDYTEVRRFGLSFTTVVNESIEGLSASAIGVYVYLQSKPPAWVIRPADIQKRFGFGRDKWRSISAELRESGLLFDKLERDAKGKVIGRVLYLGSQPIQDLPVGRVSRPTAEPSHGKSTPLVSKDSLVSKDINKGPSPSEWAFSQFWDSYPKKVDKKKAHAKFMKLKPEVQVAIIANVQTRAKQDKQWLSGFAPNPTTYLNGERWEDMWEPVSTNKKMEHGVDYV
jgi:hypothetical protein